MSASTVHIVYSGSLPAVTFEGRLAWNGVPVDVTRALAESLCQQRHWNLYDATAAARAIQSVYPNVPASGVKALADAGVTLPLLETLDLADIEAVSGVGATTVAAIGRARSGASAPVDDSAPHGDDESEDE